MNEAYMTIPLTQGQVAIVDAEDYDRISAFKWFAMWNRCTRSFYAGRNVPSSTNKHKQTTVSMHREILGSEKGTPVDHRNHDTLDNRRRNLRSATCAENCRNARIRITNRSGAKGVSLHKDTKKWIARIQVDKVQRFLGHFQSVESAHAAYVDAAMDLHGEFACTG